MVGIDHCGDKVGVEVGEEEESAGEVDHRAYVAVAVNEMERGHASGAAHPQVVGAEGAGNVNYAGTVVGGDIVAWYHTESSLAGVDPGNSCS